MCVVAQLKKHEVNNHNQDTRKPCNGVVAGTGWEVVAGTVVAGTGGKLYITINPFLIALVHCTNILKC